MASSTVKRMYIPTSLFGTKGEVVQELRSGSRSGHVPAGISIDAMAEMTRAEECRTGLL